MNWPFPVMEDVPLAEKTTFKIGGPARWYVEPQSANELAYCVHAALVLGVPIFRLGGGSNLLIADQGVNGLVIHLPRTEDFTRLEMIDQNRIRVGAAVTLRELVKVTTENGLGGLESLAGIPGTVGGAAVMNAGGADWGIGKCVMGAVVMSRDGEIYTLDEWDIMYTYRESSLAGSWVLQLDLRLTEGDSAILVGAARECLRKKAETQPLGKASAGCVFRNHMGESAGKMLDLAGCKGMAEGGARVSEKHANFIINEGGATAEQVLRLAGRMRQSVRDEHGVDLKFEIKLWA